MSFIQKIDRNPEIPQDFNAIKTRIDDLSLLESYIELKYKYFQKLRENINPFYNQAIIAWTIILHEILIEQEPITQKQIQASTRFQRSIISDMLKILIDRDLVKIIKIQGDKKKYYQAKHSWYGLALNKFDRNIEYARNVRNYMKILIKKLEANKDDSEEYSTLDLFFEKIHKSYELLEQYLQSLKVIFIQTLMKML